MNESDFRNMNKRLEDQLSKTRDQLYEANETKSVFISLVIGLRRTLVWTWWLAGIGFPVVLWWFWGLQYRFEAYCLLGWFGFFTLLSTATYKTKAVELKLEKR